MTLAEAKDALAQQLSALEIASVDSIVRSASGKALRRITTANGLDAQVSDVVDRAEAEWWLFPLAMALSKHLSRRNDAEELARAIELIQPPRLTIVAAPQPRVLRFKIEGPETREWSIGENEDFGPFEAPESSLSHDSVKKLLDWRARRGLDPDELRLLGGHLFQILFGPTLQPLVPVPGKRTALEALRDEWASANDGKTELRIILQFAEKSSVKDLSMLPWECLYVPREVLRVKDRPKWPEEGFFLSTAKDNISLLRQGKTATATRCKPPLTVMTIDARPAVGARGESPWWTTLPEGLSFEYRPLERPDLAEVTNKFTQPSDGRALHVLHIVGKADWVDPTADDRIAGLPIPWDDGGQNRTCAPASELWTRLRRDLRLVVVESVGEPFSRALQAATALVAVGCPAVVVMRQSPIAVRFFTEFYESINEGYYIDFAMNRARGKLEDSADDLGSRVLFLQALDKIVDVSSRSTESNTPLQEQAKSPSATNATAPASSVVTDALFGKKPVGGSR